jgi:hypothetical protein
VGLDLAGAGGSADPNALSPLSLGDVIQLARERRDEIEAARARVRAGEQRPTIVSAPDDRCFHPPSDHLPFMLSGADVKDEAHEARWAPRAASEP